MTTQSESRAPRATRAASTSVPKDPGAAYAIDPVVSVNANNNQSINRKRIFGKK